MRKRSWRTWAACACLAAVTATGVAVAAGTQGSQSDPLVTLSYLNDVVIPDLLRQADERIDAKTAGLTGQAAAGSESVFAAVKAAAGKTVTLHAGTQLILREGAAANTDGLVDLTDGAGMWGALTANHLYIATADGQTVTVSADALFLIQGRYTAQ